MELQDKITVTVTDTNENILEKAIISVNDPQTGLIPFINKWVEKTGVEWFTNTEGLSPFMYWYDFQTFLSEQAGIKIRID